MIPSISIPDEMAPRIQLLREYLENDNSVIHECQVCGELHPHKNKEMLSLDAIARDALDREAQRLIELGDVWRVTPRPKTLLEAFTPGDTHLNIGAEDASIDPTSDHRTDNLLRRCRGCLTLFAPKGPTQQYHDAKCRHRVHARTHYRRKHGLPLV